MEGPIFVILLVTEMAASKIFLLCFEDFCCYHGKQVMK